MKSIAMHGLVAASHSPFHPDGSLAPEVVPLQAAHVAEQGMEMVFITGSTGESHSLTRDEKFCLFEAWATAAPAHNLKVVAHVGSNCLHDAAWLAAAAADCQLAAISALAPSYYKPATLEILIECCAMISSSAPKLPFYYYDIPVLTGVAFPMDDFLRAADEKLPSLAGIKFTHDDAATYARALEAAGDRYDIPWGVDERLLDALFTGARGAVGSSYNFAASYYQQMWQAWDQGNADLARHWQKRAADLIERLAAVGYLGAAKALMSWRGVPVGPPRLPLATSSDDALAQLRSDLENSFPEVLEPSRAAV